MSRARIAIKEIVRTDARTHRAILMAGTTEVTSDVVEEGELPVRGLNVGSLLFHDIIGLCGLWKEFGDDFWSYVDGSGRSLPWEYGEYDSETIESAIAHHADQTGA